MMIDGTHDGRAPEAHPWTDAPSKYQVLRRLAVGGMAEIYLARIQGIEGFEKHVVLKRILPQYSEDPEFRRMFLDEARLAATFHHPNIAQVYDIGRSADTYFFAMEFIHGENLATVARGARALPLEHIIAIIAGACAGLHYAHERRDARGVPLGIVHRDVSPSNIMVTYDGFVKVVDFGVAKVAATANVTQQGTLKGKCRYMSPEQCAGLPLDGRSDVFALGILLFELLTRSPLFAAENELAILHQIVHQDAPRVSSRLPACDPTLDEIVARALRRARDERYPSAEALLADLEAYARQRHLTLSSYALGGFMRTTFGEKPEPWHEHGARTAASATQPLGVPLLDSSLLTEEPPTSTTPAGPGAPVQPLSSHAAALGTGITATPPTMVASGHHQPAPHATHRSWRSRVAAAALGAALFTGVVLTTVAQYPHADPVERPPAATTTSTAPVAPPPAPAIEPDAGMFAVPVPIVDAAASSPESPSLPPVAPAPRRSRSPRSADTPKNPGTAEDGNAATGAASAPTTSAEPERPSVGLDSALPPGARVKRGPAPALTEERRR